MFLPGKSARALFAVCLTAGLAAPAVFFPPPAMAADDASAVVNTVSTFYKNYTAALRKSFAGEKYDYELRQQPEVDAAFVQKIDAFIADAQKSECDALEYDPILMAQDVPEGMQYAQPVIKANAAELIAYALWSDGSKSALCVSLAQKDNAWRITDVIDMEDEETPQECGGMKTGGTAPKP